MDENKNLTTGTIFDENGYDEMQKAENHEIGFRLFRVMFFVVLLFSVALTVICGIAQDVLGMAFSLVLMTVVFAFYIGYAYMTAKRGVMNPKFAKSWSGKWVTVTYIFMLLSWILRLFKEISDGYDDLSDIAYMVMWLVAITSWILMSLCARKNNRVLENQLFETEADADRE